MIAFNGADLLLDKPVKRIVKFIPFLDYDREKGRKIVMEAFS